jgi:hypothetical protein
LSRHFDKSSTLPFSPMLQKLFSSHRFCIVCVTILVALSSSGCGQKAASVGLVRGTVTLDGKPLQFGNVVAIPSAGPSAEGVIQNGQFELSTFGKNDGAVSGTHKVIVTAREPAQGSRSEPIAGKLLVPQRYTNPDVSGLSIEVKAGEVNTPELKLTSP